LRDKCITGLEGAALPLDPQDAVSEIFAMLPMRTYRWAPNADEKAVLGYGQREDADEACRKTFALSIARPKAVPLFLHAAHRWLCRKLTNDHHEYKFLAAILEDASLVTPVWQPHLLAASVHYFHGNQTPDNSVIDQARDALRKLG